MSSVADPSAAKREQPLTPVQLSVRSHSHINMTYRVKDDDWQFPPLKKTRTEVDPKELEIAEQRSLIPHLASTASEETKDCELPEVLHELEMNRPTTFQCVAKIACLAPCRQGAVVGLKDGTVSLIRFSPFPEKASFHGLMHTGEVTCLALSSDGKIALSGSWDRSIRVWSLSTLEYVNTFLGHSHSVTCLAITSEGKFAVSGSADNTVRLWHMDEALEWMIFRGHAHIVKSLALSRDGKLCASASVDGVVKVWGLEDRREVATLEGHTDYVTCLGFTPDGYQLVSGSQDMTAKVWNVELRRETATLIGHSRYIECLAITPDGSYLVTGAGDNSVKLWALADFSEVATFLGHTQEVISLCVTPDSRYVVSGSQDHNVRVWSIAEASEVACFEGHTERVRCLAVTPDGKYIVSAAGSELKAWELEERWGVQAFEGHTIDVTSLSPTPDGQYLFSGSSKGEVKLWDLDENQEIATLQGHSAWVTCISVTPDSRFAVSTSVDKTVRLWDIHAREAVGAFDSHSSFVECMCISPDGKLIVTGSGDNTVKVWSIEQRCEVATFEGHKKWVTCVSVTPDTQYVISASVDRTARVWSLRNLQETVTFTGHTDLIECLVISPDGRCAVTGSGDRTVKVWSLITWTEEATLKGHSDRVKCLAFTPNGQLLLSGSADMTIRVWCMVGKRELTTLLGHTLLVKLIAVTPDSKFFVSGAEDNLVKLWSLEEGRELLSLSGNAKQLHCLALTPDGTSVLLGSGDNSLNSVDLSPHMTPRKLFLPSSPHASAALTPSNIHKLKSGVLTPQKVYQSCIMPYYFNSLHISAYYNHAEACDYYMRAGAQLLRGAFGSPLTVALRRNTSKCLDTMLEYLSTICVNDSASESFAAITEDLPQLLSRSSPFLVPFFSQLLTVPSQANLPQFIAPISRLPTTRFFPARLIHLHDFARPVGEETEARLVDFCISICRWNFEHGSSESLRLLRALRYCKNKKVLTTEFAATLIQKKWECFFPLTLALTLIYLVLLINLVALMFPYWRNDVLGAVFIFLNLFTLLYEVAQMVGFGQLYLIDVWNVIDLSRGALSITWTVQLLCGSDPQFLRLLVVLLCFLRGFTYFRSFKMTRIFVYMTIQVVVEIYSFLAILAYSVFAFGILASVMSEDNGVLTSWTIAFNLLMGNFDTTDFGLMQWILFMAATVVNVVIMLNLLISILGEAFSKTQMSIRENDIQQMLGLIIEYESILFCRRRRGTSTVMVKCRAAMESVGDDSEEWVGTINRIMKSIKDEHKTVNKRLKAIEAQFSSAEEKIREEIQQIAPSIRKRSADNQMAVRRFTQIPLSPVVNSAENSESDDEESETGSIALSNYGDVSRRVSVNPLIVADFARRVSANALNPLLSPDFVRRSSARTRMSSMSMKMSRMSIKEEEEDSPRGEKPKRHIPKRKTLEEKVEEMQREVTDRVASVEAKVDSVGAKLEEILQALREKGSEPDDGP